MKFQKIIKNQTMQTNALWNYFFKNPKKIKIKKKHFYEN